MTDAASADPGSFRDPTSRVYLAGDRVLRGLDAETAAAFDQLAASSFFTAALESGDVVGTRRVEAGPTDRPAVDGWAAVLEHDRVDVITYPYEWSFGMLRDAALLQLRLTAAAIDEGFITKDATPYNVQFVGSRPTFIDVGSFEPLRVGEPWYGYRQFCQLFLNPLLLQAYRDLPFQLMLRGSLEGISPTVTASLLRRRDRFRRSTFAHVTMHARAERRFADNTSDVKGQMAAAGHGPRLLAAQVANLTRAVEGLRWKAASSTWSDYTERKHYEGELSHKEDFVRRAVATVAPTQVLDLGANDGHFSAIAAERAERVLAVDSDHLVIERLYQRLRESGDDKIIPMVMDLADPSPARGWQGQERSSFTERAASDLVLCLAVVHHLALSSTVPFDLIVDFLADLGPRVVVEFPHREDPMVQRLLANKRDGLFDSYDLDHWERALARRFTVEEQVELPSGNRTLYRVTRR